MCPRMPWKRKTDSDNESTHMAAMDRGHEVAPLGPHISVTESSTACKHVGKDPGDSA